MIRIAKCVLFTILLTPGEKAQGQINSRKYQIKKETTSVNGSVASAHPLASQAAVRIMKQGGNAFDAGITAQLVLAVVYPGAGNIGGGGFMVAHTKDGKNIALDYRETAPAAAQRDMYLDMKGDPQMDLSQYGHLSAGVPGTVAGLFASLRFAKLKFSKLIEPAINLAESGFAITEREADRLNDHRNEFKKYNRSTIAFVKENSWKAGDILKQPDLAKTLKLIRDKGAGGFYEGRTADLIVAEMNAGKGIITHQDLKNYRAKFRDVLSFNYKGHVIITMPLPSSGGIILQQLLKMIEDKNIGKMGFQTAASVQLMVEAERRAFADRAEFMGDPDFVKVPVKTLTSAKYIKSRMADYKTGIAGKSTSISPGNIPESEETTHISIVDQEGNAISITTTLNGNYGSSTVVSGAGFLLNNEMDDFSVKPGVANMYGAIGNAKNAIEPGKRMLSSMTPTIVLKNNTPYIIVGTPGGTTIPTSVFQSIVNIIDFKQSPLPAVNKPKFHHQWLPDSIMIEKDFLLSTRSELINMGYTLVERDNIGRTELILIEQADKRKNVKRKIITVADKRGDDSAESF